MNKNNQTNGYKENRKKDSDESDKDSGSDNDRSDTDPVNNDRINKDQNYHYNNSNKNVGSYHCQNYKQTSTLNQNSETKIQKYVMIYNVSGIFRILIYLF